MDSTSTVQLPTGRAMPVLGLGTWQLTDDTAGAVEHALRLGYPLIDTSGDYGTQPGIAEGIRRSGVNRGDFYIVTKVEEDEDAYESAQKQVHELHLDYADLILIHRPPKDGAGERLWEGLIRARNEGVAKDIGVSNYSAGLIDKLIEASGETPAVNQVEWSPFGHSDQLHDHAKQHGIVIQAYSPLTRGERLDEAALAGIAANYDKTPAQIMIRWNLQRGIVPLPKANAKEHREENFAVFDFQLREEDMAALNGLNERYSALGELPYA